MKKRFRFRLERVLSVRSIEETMRKAELASAQFDLMAAEQKKTALENDVFSCKSELKSLRTRSPLPLTDCLQVERMVSEFRVCIRNQEKVIRSKKELFEAARRALVIATQRRMALEKLKAKCWEKHRKEISKNEAKFFDEISAMRAYARQGNR